MTDVMLNPPEKFPEFMGSNDLVGLGLFPSNSSVYLARMRGQSPNYIKIGKKILCKDKRN